MCYETMDKRRRSLTGLHLDEGTLVPNGNGTGLEALADSSDVLPSSEFQVDMLDCHTAHEQALRPRLQFSL